MSGARTLAPDSMSRSGKKAVIETVGDKRVFTDGTQTVEIHDIKGLPHADGMLIAYLPRERIVAYADMFNLPAAGQPPVPNPPVVGTQVFVANLERLGLDWENDHLGARAESRSADRAARHPRDARAVTDRTIGRSEGVGPSLRPFLLEVGAIERDLERELAVPQHAALRAEVVRAHEHGHHLGLLVARLVVADEPEAAVAAAARREPLVEIQGLDDGVRRSARPARRAPCPRARTDRRSRA